MIPLNFTGRSDLLATFAELRLEIAHGHMRGTDYRDLQERRSALGRTLRDTVGAPETDFRAITPMECDR